MTLSRMTHSFPYVVLPIRHHSWTCSNNDDEIQKKVTEAMDTSSVTAATLAVSQVACWCDGDFLYITAWHARIVITNLSLRHYIVDFCTTQTMREYTAPARLPPQETLAPLGGAVAKIFPNVSLAMCPVKVSLWLPRIARLLRWYWEYIWHEYCKSCTNTLWTITTTNDTETQQVQYRYHL